MSVIDQIRSDKWYTVSEIATIFGKHRDTVLYWIRKGYIPADGNGKFFICGRDVIIYWMKKQKKPLNQTEISKLPSCPERFSLKYLLARKIEAEGEKET